MSKLELWFYRGLQNIAVWVGAVVFLIPSLFLSVFLMGEAFQWFDKAHWIRITLCTLGNAARETRTHGNVFVLHELDRCDVDTGAKGLDLILNYYVNELSLFVSVPIYSILGMIVFGWLAGKWGNRADEIEVELTRQHYRQHSEDERAY